MSCGVGPRCSSDLALLGLWHRLAATAPIQPLACICPWCGPKKKKKDKKRVRGSSHCGLVIMNTTSVHEDIGSIPGPAQWVEDPVLPLALV